MEQITVFNVVDRNGDFLQDWVLSFNQAYNDCVNFKQNGTEAQIQPTRVNRYDFHITNAGFGEVTTIWDRATESYISGLHGQAFFKDEQSALIWIENNL